MPADFDPSSGSSLAGSSLASSSAAPAAPSMIFDDRLETVLRTRAAGPAGLRVQFRQLVDLLGRVPEQGWNARHDEALARLDTLFEAIATPQEGARPAQAGPAASLSGAEAAAALLAATHLAHPRLVAHFAAQGPRVALASIRGARLDEASWLDLIPRLPIQARGFLRHRRDLGPAVERLLEQLGIDDFALTGPEVPVETGAVAEQAPEPMPAAKLPEETAEEAEDLAPDTLSEPASPVSAPIEGIGAIVRRIEAFRRDREERQAAQASPATTTTSGSAPAPRLSVDSASGPSADDTPPPLAIDLAFDPQGTIVAADADFAPMLVGHRPFPAPHLPARFSGAEAGETKVGDGSASCPAMADAPSLRAFAARQPIENGIVRFDGAPAIEGFWQLDATPLFSRMSGAFAGYRGRLRRPPPEALAQTASGEEASPTPQQPTPEQAGPEQPAGHQGADRLRQTLHELRTPINAIQGFAEMIQQQVFGAAPHQYRSLAASIAADAARMLAGFEDLERLARLESAPAGHAAASSSGAGNADDSLSTDLAALLTRLIVQLDPVIGPREVRLRWEAPAGGAPVAVAPGELEHTIWRLLAVIASTAAPGERLSITLAPEADPARPIRLDLPLPAALAMREDAALFALDSYRGGPNASAGAGLGPGGMMGNGFALRLAMAEVRAMGGQMRREAARLLIDLPRARAIDAGWGGSSLEGPHTSAPRQAS